MILAVCRSPQRKEKVQGGEFAVGVVWGAFRGCGGGHLEEVGRLESLVADEDLWKVIF